MFLEPWRDQHPLEGPFLMLKRAKNHLETLDKYLVEFDALNPHRVTSQLNSDKTFHECRLIAQFPPFLDFWLAIGEFCYQVRSALDQIAYSLCVFPATLSPIERAKAESSSE